MAINLKVPETKELRPRITVLGVGGAGGNAVNNMIAAKLEGVDFVVANTDAQALAQSKAERRIQLGARITEGLGAGAQPDVGRAGAEESLDEILEQLAGSHMVFITAGMGGGTGTGAAPVIARAVREAGILTVGVVTKPFAFEGDKRMRIAERGIDELQQFVHTLIVIPNQNLFRVANDRTTFAQAFAMADEVLHAGVRGVTDLIVMPGLINLDFADIKSVISRDGQGDDGHRRGRRRGPRHARRRHGDLQSAARRCTMKGARGVLINITGGPDLMLFEVEQAANRIRAEVDPDANIIFGNTILADMEGRIRVSVVATGIDAEHTEAAGKGAAAPAQSEAGAALPPRSRQASGDESRPGASGKPGRRTQRQRRAFDEGRRGLYPGRQRGSGDRGGAARGSAGCGEISRHRKLSPTERAAFGAFAAGKEGRLEPVRPQENVCARYACRAQGRAAPCHRPADAACGGARSAASCRRRSFPRSRP